MYPVYICMQHMLRQQKHFLSNFIFYTFFKKFFKKLKKNKEKNFINFLKILKEFSKKASAVSLKTFFLVTMIES